jgi:hypothetical protein
MSDPRLPSEMDEYMVHVGWGEHHDQWHYEQRYDFWRHRAAQGDEGAAEIVAYGDAKGWKRAKSQEGAPGHGLHFLAMHRAMFQLLAEQFPQHRAYLAGWSTPPQNPADADDPVPGGAPFAPEKAEGVVIVETRHADFPTDDDFALFLETNIRPTATDPTNRTPDARTGLHNWLHNRWTDGSSPVNLGDPTVNIFNARFWRLHGWIDRLWSEYRRFHGFGDDEAEYVELLGLYRHMMEHGGHHIMTDQEIPPRPERLKRSFAD